MEFPRFDDIETLATDAGDTVTVLAFEVFRHGLLSEAGKLIDQFTTDPVSLEP